MEKRIANIEFQPLCFGLSDRPISTFIDSKTGNVFLDEGDGPDRIHGAVLRPINEPRFVFSESNGTANLTVNYGRLVHYLGQSTEVDRIEEWASRANRQIELIAAQRNTPAIHNTTVSKMIRDERHTTPLNETEKVTVESQTAAAAVATTPNPSGKPGGQHRPFRKGMTIGQPGDAPANDSSNGPSPHDRPAPQPKLDYGRAKPSKRDLDALIEADLVASLATLNVSQDLASTKENSPPHQPGVPGGRKKGRVVKIHGDDVFLELPGGRSQGYLSKEQFEGKPPEIGEDVEVEVERYDSANGMLVLNLAGAVQKVADWSGIQKGMIVEVRVTGANKGGLAVELGSIRGFLPFSQIDIVRVEQPELLVNSRVKCMIMEANPSEKNLVVSRRMLIEKEREAMAVEFWAKLEEGQSRTGTIKSIKPFGAFVDLGGADGLIPMGEMSWSRIADASEVVTVGQTVEVRVIRIDKETKRIGLSLKVFHKNPWDDFALRCRPGTKLTGKVTRIAEFGAFVEVEPGIEGLLHVSELSTQRVRRVRDLVTEGQLVEVQVTNVDAEARRLGLSLKAIAVAAEDGMRAEEATAMAAKISEEREDRKIAEEKMATRKSTTGNLRGGIGAGGALFTMPGQ